MTKLILKFVIALGIIINLCACQSLAPSNLYRDLGEQAGITEVVDNLLFKIADNPKILHHFEGVDIDRFRNNFIIHLCELSDGPCRFEGDSMRDIHAGMNITAAEFDSLVENLIDAMEEAGVTFQTQNRLVSRMIAFRDEIVSRGSL